MASKNPKQSSDKGGNPGQSGQTGGQRPSERPNRTGTPEPSQPRFDDRPERTSRSGEGSRETNPSLPRYGDTERDDPRRAHTEAGGDAESEPEGIEDESGDEEER